jgi:WD40 repeat protein
VLICASGHAAVHHRRNQFVVDNATDGFDLYNIETNSFLRNFPTGIPTKNYPKQVAFGEDAKVVVGGSDHGVVYVFDRKTGNILDVLRHADRGLVQTITVRSKIIKSQILPTTLSLDPY